MINAGYIILASAPKKTAKKTTATVAQNDLFEKNFPLFQASVAQTFSGDFFMTMIGVAVILAAAAVYVVRRSGITI
ncbi:MAG: hypothetical protein Q7R85_01230 [bacterium]|nr:hypothetical protein [bacterium]